MRCCEVRGSKVRRSKVRGTPELWAAAATTVETAATAAVETAGASFSRSSISIIETLLTVAAAWLVAKRSARAERVFNAVRR